jgi:nucleotide-binding universal stress UspA family protein
MSTVIVGVDGSEDAQRAVAWCAEHATAFGDEVVAVHAIETPSYIAARAPYVWINVPTDEQSTELEEHARTEWCKPLADAGISYRVVVRVGGAAPVLIDVAAEENAVLVVTGRRGLGGFKELLVGSTSHHLAHHLDRPLVIVP